MDEATAVALIKRIRAAEDLEELKKVLIDLIYELWEE